MTQTPGLKVTLDPTHIIYQGFGLEAAYPLLVHTRHIHLRGGMKGRLQVPMSKSAFDVEPLIGAALDTGYDGYLTCEYVWEEWEGNNECDTLSESILVRDRVRAYLSSRGGQKV